MHVADCGGGTLVAWGYWSSFFSRVISRMSFSAHYFHVEDVGKSARSFEVWRRHLMQGREDAMQHKRNAAETQSTDLGNAGLGATKIHNDGG